MLRAQQKGHNRSPRPDAERWNGRSCQAAERSKLAAHIGLSTTPKAMPHGSVQPAHHRHILEAARQLLPVHMCIHCGALQLDAANRHLWNMQA